MSSGMRARAISTVAIVRSNGRPSLTPGQNAFLEARKAAHLDHDTLAQTHPESFFIPQ